MQPLPDSLHNICLRSRPHRTETLRYRIRLYVLGSRYSALLRCRPSRGRSQWQHGLAIAFRPSMGLANPALHRRLSCSRISMECRSKRQSRRSKESAQASPYPIRRKRLRGRSHTGLYPAHHSHRKGRDCLGKLHRVFSRNKSSPY